jgi:NAD(P)-dependent dehydrogenase (short-subunit alcohol dehydrogenase family)
VHEITEDEWDLMLDIDLTGSWRAMRAAVPLMLARRSGSVINISSTAGMVGYRYFAAYVAAKHGMIGLTRAAALDYAAHNIRVNALCPGSVRDDPALDGRMLSEIARCLDVPVAGHERTFTASQPTNRLAEAADVARTAVWLAGDEAAHVTGAVIPVDGGFTAR